jgi:hypothetical protein
MRFLLILLMLLPQLILAGPLEDALAIVFGQSETLKTKNSAIGIVSKGSNLDIDVKVATGYSDKTTDEYAAGWDKRGMLTFKYPLYGSGTTRTDEQKAAALSSRNETQEGLLKSFLADMKNLTMLRVKMRISNRAHKLSSDLLTRMDNKNKAAEKQGRSQDIVDITSLLDRAISASGNAEIATYELTSQTEMIARAYGKTEWITLQEHIEKYVKSMGKAKAKQISGS